jgi:hypothetical protein
MDETRTDGDDDDEGGNSEDEDGEYEDGTGSAGDRTVSHSQRSHKIGEYKNRNKTRSKFAPHISLVSTIITGSSTNSGGKVEVKLRRWILHFNF